MLREIRPLDLATYGPKLFQHGNRSRLRVVAITRTPALTAILSADWPKDDVAPRMTSNCPFVISRLRNRQVQAVAKVSGIAASSAHGSSASIMATFDTGARVYSA
jgi:hypothetical protein